MQTSLQTGSIQMGDDALDSYLVPWRKAEPGCALAGLFLQPDERIRFGALAALQREWLKIVREVSEPQVAATKLGWWREEVQRAVQGQARHPLAQALFKDARVQKVPLMYWTAAVDAALAMILAPPPADFAAQCEAMRPLAAALAGLEMRVWFGEATDSRYATEATLFGLLIDDLRALGVMLGNGHSPLPMNLLARHGLSIDDLAADTPARRAAVRDQAGELERGLTRAATMQGRLALFRGVRLRDDQTALRHALYAEDPLQALGVVTPGFRNLLKTWRAARTWRKTLNTKATP